jgi:hypothetical protein
VTLRLQAATVKPTKLLHQLELMKISELMEITKPKYSLRYWMNSRTTKGKYIDVT